ncbi:MULTISPECIES: AraC family transcriptional regulator [unclassified Pseudoalteromonas]|uniref:AraC family transcriptional regulator n=1 Tax=unclassified Pseudoalteromonas TaxID=194690 RepID=UPI001F19A906|nr:MULTISPECIES: AraC family transcriptional regulator [unclassified Pseudoalteromonas]MCF2825482.1 AraC family transcriptional regulator [Pseudoalteromonas sp. OF5H-5]MCF2831962.1 AraC family transcriptional regulator [Pseudoalteromonas sp. DL2-H6]MCF2923139.1 AraC family transcriptional regulator [Pseudoalteromonas sp. DL2-H1]
MQSNLLQQRISLVCDYINQHLDDELTVSLLSDVAALSKFHFHRVFVAFMGVNVGKYILLARLKRASFRLAFERDIKIIDIALEAKFDSAEAFSRAFKRTFEQSPSQFRQAANWPSWYDVFNFSPQNLGVQTMQVDIINFEQTQIAFLEHKGAAKLIFESAGKFIAWRQNSGLSPINTSRTFGMPNGDPETMAEDAFRFKLCGSVNTEVPDNTFGVERGVIPQMRCAKVRHLGSHDNMEQTIRWLYQNWLADSGELPNAHCCFFEYHNFVHQVDECDLITDIYLPLQN